MIRITPSSLSISRTLKSLLALLLFFSSLSVANELPLDDFIKHGDYLDVEISPDGKHLAARIQNDLTIALIFVRLADGKVVGGGKPEENNVIFEVQWVNNDRVIFELADKRHYLDRAVPTGELYGINLDGSRRELLYGYRAGDARTGSRLSKKKDAKASQDVLNILENDPKNILIIEYPWSKIGNYWYNNRSKPPIVSKLNIYSGKKKKIEVIPHTGARVITDKNGNINFSSWIDSEGKFKAAYRKNADMEWQPLASTFDLAKDPVPFRVDASGEKVYMWGTTGEAEMSTVIELDIASGQFTPLATDIQYDIDSSSPDLETLKPAVLELGPGRAEYRYPGPDSRTARIHKKLAGAFKGQDIDFMSSSNDGKILVLKVSSDINPGEYYVFNTETNKADFLWANKSWIDPAKMRPMTPIRLSARDGVSLHGYLTLPLDKTIEGKPVKPPLVVLPHGGPFGIQDNWKFNTEVQLLANRGYAVLQVNFRGSGGYGEKFLKAGYKQWGGTMIDDIIDATQWVVSTGNVDGKRMCLYGTSYGGYAALMTAAREPALFKCTVGYAGVYDMNYMYTNSDISKHWGGKAFLERTIGHDQQQLTEYSPVNHAGAIQAAVMLIHGNQDARASIDNAADMRRALEKHNKEVTWLTYGVAGHGVWNLDDRRELYAGVLEFLDEHIGAEGK